MRLLIAAIGLAIFASGCTKSSVQLLKEGDPQVCTKEDVTDQVFEIIKENAVPPNNNGLLINYDTLAPNWIKAVSFTIDGITSKDVDVANQKITCTGQVHIKAEGVERQQETTLDYQVVSNLSEGKPIVSVDTSQSGPALSRILSAIAAPLFQAANQKRIAQVESDREEWLNERRFEIKSKRAVVAAQYVPGTFTASELDAITKVEVVKDECLRSIAAGDFGDLACQFREALIDDMHKSDLCNPESSNWTHCNTPVSLTAAQPNSAFSADEAALIAKADSLNDRCRGGDGDQTEKACNDRQALIPFLKSRNLCWGPEDAIEADKYWLRCS